MIDCIARTSGAAMKASCKARVSRLGVWPRSMYRTCCWMCGRDVSCGYRAHMSRYVDMAGPRCGANRLGCTRSGSPTMMPSAWVYARFAGTSCHVRTWPLLRTRVRPLGCDACSPWSCKALTSARTCSSLAAPARRRFGATCRACRVMSEDPAWASRCPSSYVSVAASHRRILVDMGTGHACERAWTICSTSGQSRRRSK